MLVAVCGCSSSGESPADSGAPEASTGGGDDASSAGPDADAGAGPTTIAVSASLGTWQADEEVTLTGSGSGDLGAIAITHGVGTLTFQGTAVDAFYFVGSVVPLADAGADSALAQERDLELVAVQPGRVILAWITCYEGDLAYVYYETTDGLASSKSQPASGTCAVVDPLSTAEAVSLPALSMPAPAPVTGFTITGPQLSYGATSGGKATFAGTTWSMFPFHVIDCSACASPGWYELHSIFWAPGKRAACAGILYLQASSTTEVELAYLLCLPGVTSPIANDQLFFGSSWTKG